MHIILHVCVLWLVDWWIAVTHPAVCIMTGFLVIINTATSKIIIPLLWYV